MLLHKYILFMLLSIALLSAPACAQQEEAPTITGGPAEKKDSSEVLRNRLIDEIEADGIRDQAVLEAMRKVARHEFVPKRFQAAAYEDRPLAIGYDQTISQPYIVGYMTQALELEGDEKVLEIGTGSGYQAAVLAEIVRDVYTIEILEPLARGAQATLERLGYKNVHVKAGDGYQGWPEHAPFDAIIVTAAPDHIPQPLVDQLAVGGRMVIPVGSWYQRIILLTKDSEGVAQQEDIPVMFVPMTGEAQQRTGE